MVVVALGCFVRWSPVQLDVTLVRVDGSGGRGGDIGIGGDRSDGGEAGASTHGRKLQLPSRLNILYVLLEDFGVLGTSVFPLRAAGGAPNGAAAPLDLEPQSMGS